MKNYQRYTRKFFMPPEFNTKWAEKTYIDAAPQWCSVDLRDGNQALIVPMSLDEKIRFFQLLTDIGFKEIEVGFPAASDTEHDFLRAIIEGNIIPDGVAVQVLTQSREHIIAKTFDALKGAKDAIVHLYNSTSKAQREQVFRKSKEEIIELAVSGAKLIKEYAEKYEGNFRFEYSPESFSGTEPDFALDICNAVIDVWQPTPENKVIINLPNTVESAMPHIYAAQIAYICKNINRRDSVIISVHPHNDRGCAVADAEMSILAGAERVEGTLFGNGERTGNVDLVTLAMNMFSQGIDPQLDFSDMPKITDRYEECTGMRVYERQPYSGQLVFAAFSGSHQDAIAKGMKCLEQQENNCWDVPYLPIDPGDVGRKYENDVIRINSQSGKGGIGFLMERRFGFDLPPKMREDFGYFIKGISDREHRELQPQEICDSFIEEYVNIDTGVRMLETHYAQRDGIEATITYNYNGAEKTVTRFGNGRLDAVSNAIRDGMGISFKITTYKEHALEQGSTSNACAYVGIITDDGKVIWGAGVDSDIMRASVSALISAINRMLR